ncbi:MAG: Glucose dehydrogenase, PQQ-dependent [Rhodanobacteraceae bacterium]|jgi:quinoprotein glucose dehydrogenase|nr:MAG: Glucose dehydrogenase, PQQ-dependent [Rhodanobacteraceae bacterium]
MRNMTGWCVAFGLAALLAGCGRYTPPPPAADAGWAYYGGDAGGSRYSTAAQITPANVKHLQVAWTFRSGEDGAGFPGDEWTSHMTWEATPILYDGALYFTTSETNVVAVDATTGKLRWRHDSHVPKLWYSDAASRGVTLWIDPQSPAYAPCHARIFAPTLDSRLLALDAKTGKLCEDFANHGVLDLLPGIRSTWRPGDKWRNYLVTSPPVILDGKVIFGSSVGDNRGVELERGTVRAYDARTGKFAWGWDPIPRDPSNPVYAQWTPKAAAITGAANAWAPLSVDTQRHLVFVPTGSASPDFFGGLRPGDNRWANSVIALDGDTGKLAWGYQLVHHDLWDYDSAAQPSLVTLQHDGRAIPAVIQPTKTGMLFTFDRENGTPVFPIVEKAVPQDGAPGEVPSKTQPFPTMPSPLVRQGPVTKNDLAHISFGCHLERYKSEGIFTPPSVQGSIEQPGYAGGVEWGGLAFDPIHQVAVVNTNDLPMVVALVPRDQLEAQKRSKQYDDWGFSLMRGTPFAMRRRPWTSSMGAPCIKPPWGELSAIDMRSGKRLWQIPLGNAIKNHWNLGMPGMGGPVVTASGLVFVAATMDDDIRAIDEHSGKLLWQYHLPAGGQATPMTYAIGGRQYLVIVAGGHGELGTRRGDYVIAFALPK